MQSVDNGKPLLAPASEEPYKIREVKDGAPVETDAHISHLVKLLIRQMPVDNMNDSFHGLRVLELAKGTDDPPETLEFEDADHAWLIKKVEAAGPKVFGLMAQRVRDALQPMSVADRKAARSEPKTKPTSDEAAE